LASRGGPTPFWLDEDWHDGIARHLVAERREAFDDAMTGLARPIWKLRQGSPEWAYAEVEGRRRLEADWGPP